MRTLNQGIYQPDLPGIFHLYKIVGEYHAYYHYLLILHSRCPKVWVVSPEQCVTFQSGVRQTACLLPSSSVTQ